MRNFKDDEGRATRMPPRARSARRATMADGTSCSTPGAPEAIIAAPEVRWQTAESALRTLRTMAEFELVRRVIAAQGRSGSDLPAARRA